MKPLIAGSFALALCATATFTIARAQHTASAEPGWNARGAATYLDDRMAWWLTWPNAARDHDTACVSCHTSVPYALSRPALRATLGERDLPAAERGVLAHVTKRVTLWRDVDPFYPDQTRGLPKSSESRGTEAVLNALILSLRDRQAGALSEDGRRAFDNMWALQFKNGDLKGAWAWLNFRYEPWESTRSPYMGATLAALAVGGAPGGYASSPAVQDQVTLLREYLQKGAEGEPLFNQIMALWASTTLPGVLRDAQRAAIVDRALAKQQEDGGWAIASLGEWKRVDGTPLDLASDGYGTGLITLVLQQVGLPRTDAAERKGRSWLIAHQDKDTGGWRASSLNKRRDPATDAAKFMDDAATAFAALALAQGLGAGAPR